MDMRQQVLKQAHEIITGDRHDSYGPAENSFQRISMLWEAYLGMPITDLDVAWMMVLLKIARSQHNRHHIDNYIDVAGYAALASELAKEEG